MMSNPDCPLGIRAGLAVNAVIVGTMGASFTVSMAPLEVALPEALVTTTLKVAPLSDVVAGGVV